MKSRPLRHFTASALLGASLTTAAQPRPAVLELFTSEGCSSCPPAEVLVGELARRPDVLVLSYHVDYWDNLGWRDRFASTAATQRQRTYAGVLGLPSVYTPQAVIDGHGNFVGSDRAAIGAALATQRTGVPVAIAVSSGTLLIDVAAQPNAPHSDVVLVAYQRAALSPIGRGENAGRVIRETNVVREFHSLGRWDGSAQRYSASTATLPAEATDVAILVQAVGQSPVVGAATAALR